MAEEEDNLKNGKMGKKNGILKGKKPIEKNGVRSKLQEFITVESSDAAKVKGFLELNPYICSGCGTPFQSKTEGEAYM
jgi:rubrerythrin